MCCARRIGVGVGVGMGAGVAVGGRVAICDQFENDTAFPYSVAFEQMAVVKRR